MPPIQLATFIRPAKAYRLQYPAHWEHLEKDDGRSCGFGPRDRDDVGLWITILPVSIDGERLEQDLPKIFRQAISDEGTNVRRDPTLRHFGLTADMAKGEEAGQFWIILQPELHRLLSGPLGSPFYCGCPERQHPGCFFGGR